MVQMDGKDHDLRRSIVAPVMVGKKLEHDYQPMINEVVSDLLAVLPKSGEVDAIKAITSPLPLKIIARMLGMESSYDEYLHEVANLVINALAGVEPAKSLGKAKHEEFARNIDDLISKRIVDPTDDLITEITQSRSKEGEGLSRTEIASFISLLMVAGGETSDRAISNFWYVLLKNPHVLEAIRKDRSLMEPAISEFMRRDGVVVYEDRELNEDVEWYGTRIAKGEIVRVAMMSANNDDTVFKNPRTFDLYRTDLNLGFEKRPGGSKDGVSHHVGFGLGKHFCIGYHLARAEMSTATNYLLDRYENIALSPDHEPALTVQWFHRFLDKLVLEVS
jgi:pulcherriminic acid synthase